MQEVDGGGARPSENNEEELDKKKTEVQVKNLHKVSIGIS